MLLLLFDTETTGLPPKFESKVNERNVLLWPHILQFSYVLFDTETNTVVKKIDSIIKIPAAIIINQDSVNIHKITREKSDLEGVSIVPVIEEFMSDLEDSDLLIGHNIEFDLNMIYAAIMRN